MPVKSILCIVNYILKIKAMKRLLLSVAICLNVLSTQAQGSLSTGLVMYLPFNGNANDVSGYGNNGVIVGSTLTPTTDEMGKPNSAYYFDGTGSSYIKVKDDFLLSPQRFTVCAKVYPQGFYEGDYKVNCILSKGDLFLDTRPICFGIRSFLLCDACYHTDLSRWKPIIPGYSKSGV